MKAVSILLALFVSASAVLAQAPVAPGLHGLVTDPSGASVAGAVVQLRGQGPELRRTTDANGQYSFPSLAPGKYSVRAIAKGFTVFQNPDVEINGQATLDVQLTIESDKQVVNVEAEANKVTTDPENNGGAIVLKAKEIETLSDDPDELSAQLQAMAGPGAGPSGGQIYIDGFTGGNLPPKSSIREIRINSNPFSPEYDRPGFGRIEIFTRAGTDNFHAGGFMQYNNENLNSRSALLATPTRPQFKQELFGFNLSGPIKKNKASFTLDANRRSTTENALIIATTLDSNLAPQTLNQAVLTPLTFTTISPRVDYAINASNNLSIRYQNTRSSADNQGVGSFNLASRAYDTTSSENTVQGTETAVLSATMINETRFQYMHIHSGTVDSNLSPGLIVQGAFSSGGSQSGNSGTTANRWEVTNTSTYNHKAHTFKWGARLRQSFDSNTSLGNFGGTYTFLGTTGPQLDANNNPIAGTSTGLTALEAYRRTLLFQQQGYSDSAIRQLGGGAYQFSLSAGTPTTSVNLFDVGLFFNDDWRARPNLTVSYGIRYENQTNISDYGNFSPRIGIAWALDQKGNTAAKTVLRAGFGIFYDRIADSVDLQALRFNGVTQQSYVIANPGFFPSIPALSVLAAGKQPQQLQFVDSHIAAPRNFQSNIGIDRTVNKYFRVSVNYISSRGVHLQRSRDINAPINGAYPFGDSELRLLTESTGFSRTNMITVNPNLNYKKIVLFGYYGLAYGKSDAEGSPADPYNLRAEWGPSFADVRHRAVFGTSLTLPFRITASPMMLFSTGSPYNITTGRDLNDDNIISERPALLANVAASSCATNDLVYRAGFGCFNLNPAPGTPTIQRNLARGPGSVVTMLRVGRTWSFGGKREPVAGAGMGGPGGPGGGPGGGGGMMMGGGGGGGMRGGGGPPGGGGGGGGPMMMGGGPMGLGGPGNITGRRYNLTLSVSASNPLNHTNFAPPSGDLSSPYFGVYRSLAGGFGGSSSTYNRKIDLQVRFSF